MGKEPAKDDKVGVPRRGTFLVHTDCRPHKQDEKDTVDSEGSIERKGPPLKNVG